MTDAILQASMRPNRYTLHKPGNGEVAPTVLGASIASCHPVGSRRGAVNDVLEDTAKADSIVNLGALWLRRG